MSRVYKGLVNGSLTVAVSERVKRSVGAETDELTLRLFDSLVADRDLIRERWYLDNPEEGYGHRRRNAADARYERFKVEADTALRLAAIEKEPGTEGYEGSPVYADLTRGFWSHDGPEDVPGDRIGRLTRNGPEGLDRGNGRLTRRKWKLI